ncbi:MAG TPA: hypothetical protein VNE17_12670 [Nitrolancea sp.]|nr:hypothetical protein [Nitrolancea sp.]
MGTLAPAEIAALKQRAVAEIDRYADQLTAVSQRIWENPEIAFQEMQAAGWLTELLLEADYRVERGVGGLPTAFTARRVSRQPGPTVGIFSEYDALINLGNGSGHNLLAISGVGAGIGLAAVADDLPGSVQIHLRGHAGANQGIMGM